MTKRLPAFGGVAAPIDVDHAAFGGGALGDAHLVEAVLAQHGERPRLRRRGRGGRSWRWRHRPGSLDADELALVVRRARARRRSRSRPSARRCAASGRNRREHSICRSRSTGVSGRSRMTGSGCAGSARPGGEAVPVAGEAGRGGRVGRSDWSGRLGSGRRGSEAVVPAVEAAGLARPRLGSRTRPTAPVAPSTYQGPASPRMTAGFRRQVGGRLAGNDRSSPRLSVLPVACQRPLPMRASSPSTELTALGATGHGLGSPPPSKRAMMRFDSGLAAVAEDVGRRGRRLAVPSARRSGRWRRNRRAVAAPGESSNISACRSSAGAAVSVSRKLLCTGLRRAG